MDDTRASTEPAAKSTWAERLRNPGWVLLPLRLFLGFTFTFAGLDKLADPHFFEDASDPLSVAAQLQGFKETSPIGPLVGIAADHPVAAGVLISLTEIAIGLATLVGLWARLAAAGGALLSLSFLLTVSWQTRPYYYGSDIGFLVSWIPIIAVGTAGVLSLDGAFQKRRPAAEPMLSRRSLLRYGGAAGVLATIALAAAGVANATRDRLPRRNTAGSGSTSPAPGGPGTFAATKDVPVGDAVLVDDPRSGKQVHVLQPTEGKFTALSAICTHTGCTVAWTGKGFDCPCHGSKFDAEGKVLQGPAARPLDGIPVRVDGSNVVAE